MLNYSTLKAPEFLLHISTKVRQNNLKASAKLSKKRFTELDVMAVFKLVATNRLDN